MKKFAAAIAAFGFVGAASAADMPIKAPIVKAPVAPIYNWTGFYVGVNGGGGWGNTNVDYTPIDPGAISIFGLGGQPPAASIKKSGAIGGVQIGYNWQPAPTWLLGLEADFDWSGIKGSATTNASEAGIVPVANTVEEKVKWLGTVRGRLGYLPLPNLLAFVTGGFAYGEVERTGTYINIAGFFATSGVSCSVGTCYAGSSNAVSTGWTVGGGLEYALWQRWTLRGEYLYVSLSGKSVTETAALGSSFNANFGRSNLNIARVALNYRF